jgi:hypothetical protein
MFRKGFSYQTESFFYGKKPDFIILFGPVRIV